MVYKNTKKKELHTFMAFDVVDFYPSITIDLLRVALDFASSHTNISDDEQSIIMQAKSSLLYSNGEPWFKKMISNTFDVTMGSYDGAESCELVGTFLLNTIRETLGDTCNLGLYRDDGLLLITRSTPRQSEVTNKKLCSIFAKYGLKNHH